MFTQKHKYTHLYIYMKYIEYVMESLTFFGMHCLYSIKGLMDFINEEMPRRINFSLLIVRLFGTQTGPREQD